MPELPEVETIVRELRTALLGKKLQKFFVYDKKRLATPKLHLPQKIASVRRHGKYIVCETDKNVCIIHLRMTGELLLGRRSAKAEAPHSPIRANWRMGGKNTVFDERNPHERASFYFSDGSLLIFIDVRRFGTIEWKKNGHALPDLGPDPLSKVFNARFLADVVRGSSRSIKSLLLDQKIIAGIGNIYADEALWHAKIYPARKSNTINPAEAGKLVLAIKKVLSEGIEKGGFTLRDYRHIDGSFGYYQKSRKVYDREGLLCLRVLRNPAISAATPRTPAANRSSLLGVVSNYTGVGLRGSRSKPRRFATKNGVAEDSRCRVKIKRIKLGGRSSYYCPKCQQ